ncbi:MAG TPA: hypothetical protein VJQ51_11740 [Burkholderiales bacterium]|nr:hypothetical protein [Burkholderiales bacterium]
MAERRGITIHFNDGSKLSANFPKQAANDYAAMMKVDDVLKKRYILMEADDTFMMIPFENIRYIQIYPAPKEVPNHTYLKGVSLID